MTSVRHVGLAGILGAAMLWGLAVSSVAPAKAAEDDPSPEPLEWLKERDLADRSLGGAKRFRVHPHLDRALRAMAEGDVEKALASAENLLRIAPRHRQGLFVAALANHRAGRFTESVGAGRTLREIEPDFAPVHLYLGLAWQALGEWDAAEAAYIEALALRSLPTDQDRLARLSLAELRTAASARNADAGQPDTPPVEFPDPPKVQQAEKTQVAAPATPPAPRALLPRPAPPAPPPQLNPADAGYAALARGDEAGAAALLQRALAAPLPKSQRRQILADLGYLAAKRGDHRRAATHFSAALDLAWDPSLALTLIQQLRQLGELADAKHLFERIDPVALPEVRRLDYLRLGAGLNPEARAEWVDRLAQAGEDPAVWYRAGLAWQQQGQRGRARAAFAKAVAGDPENVQFAAALGYAELTLGQKAPAAAAFEQASRLDPDNAALIQQLAYLDLERGDYPQARQRLRHAAELETDAAQRQNLQRQLDMLPKPFRFPPIPSFAQTSFRASIRQASIAASAGHRPPSSSLAHRVRYGDSWTAGWSFSGARFGRSTGPPSKPLPRPPRPASGCGFGRSTGKTCR